MHCKKFHRNEQQKLGLLLLIQQLLTCMASEQQIILEALN